MDIRDWSLDKIMQLPDCCFGRRWPITLKATGIGPGPVFDISEAGLPEKCVIWELCIIGLADLNSYGTFGLRLGDVLPTTTAEFEAYEMLFKSGPGSTGALSEIGVSSMSSVNWNRLRLPILAAGRRLVLGIRAGILLAVATEVTIVVSSIPTEVPDWLCSGRV